MRLIDHLKSLGLAPRTARQALTTGKVWYGDAPTADASREVQPERVRYRPSSPLIRVGRDPVIVYRDEHLAVVWKPAGLLAVPAAGRHDEASLLGKVSGLLRQRAFVVHRLDELTSGLMMVARTAEVAALLRAMFAAHAIERHYLAIVNGVFASAPQTQRSFLVRNRGDGLRGASDDEDDPSGREAVTHFSLVEQFGKEAALVEARLETGRTHQVRIHLAELGHPVLGDKLYGGHGVGRRLPRYALHACVLGFRHPVTGRTLRFVAPLADDLEQHTRALRTHTGLLSEPGSRTPARDIGNRGKHVHETTRTDETAKGARPLGKAARERGQARPASTRKRRTRQKPPGARRGP